MSTLEPTTHQADWWELLFYFPGDGTTAQVCGFFLADRPWLACLLCLPLVYQSSGSFLCDQPHIKGKCCLPYTCLFVVDIPTLWVYVAPLISSSSQLWSPHNKVLNAVREKGVSSAAFHKVREARHSLTGFLSPSGETMCCFPWEWYDAGKVIVSLSHPKATKLFFLSFSPVEFFLQALPNHSQEELEVVHSLL